MQEWLKVQVLSLSMTHHKSQEKELYVWKFSCPFFICECVCVFWIVHKQNKTKQSKTSILIKQQHIKTNTHTHTKKDGPTTTHGGMFMGAGMVAAENCGASEIIDPRPYAVGSIAQTFKLWELCRIDCFFFYVFFLPFSGCLKMVGWLFDLWHNKETPPRCLHANKNNQS